jgi:hypothetical protein
MTPRLSILIATKGRPTLMRAIYSTVGQMRPGDQLIVDRNDDHPQGHAALNRQIPNTTGDVLLGVADDDYFTPGALELIRVRYAEAPDRIHVFKMRYSDGTELWAAQEFACGNVSPSMTALPNRPEWLGTWGEGHYNGDFDFLAETRARMPNQEVVWHGEIIQIIELPPRRGGTEH